MQDASDGSISLEPAADSSTSTGTSTGTSTSSSTCSRRGSRAQPKRKSSGEVTPPPLPQGDPSNGSNGTSRSGDNASSSRSISSSENGSAGNAGDTVQAAAEELRELHLRQEAPEVDDVGVSINATCRAATASESTPLPPPPPPPPPTSRPCASTAARARGIAPSSRTPRDRSARSSHREDRGSCTAAGASV